MRRDSLGYDVEVGRRGRGEFFGEMALIDGDVRSATIETVTPCLLFVLERPVFLEVVAPSVPLLGKLLYELSRKFREVSERVVRDDVEMRTRDADAELARHRAITQAVTGLAHELNTPLGVCVTAASLIVGATEADSDLGEAARLLTDNLARSADLVRAFVAIAALDGAERPEDQDLRDVIVHAEELVVLERPSASLAIRHAGFDGPCPWRGARGPLERVVLELLLNVADHAYPDMVERRVDIAIRPAFLEGRPAWRVAVADRGRGVAEPVRRSMFDAFVTTARARGRKGLGLTLVYNAVTGPLRGRVQTTTGPGEGTEIALMIPMMPYTDGTVSADCAV